jgi:hypothetical protein
VRRFKWWAWVAIVLAVLVIGAGAFVWTQRAQAVTIGSVSPVPGSYVATHSVTVACPLQNYRPGRGHFTVLVDGQAIPGSAISADSQGVQADLTLQDGSHNVVVDYTPSGLFGHDYSRSTTVVVDTTSPTLQLVSPSGDAVLASTPTHIEARSNEPVVSPTLAVDGRQVSVSAAGDEVTADVGVGDGTHEFELTVSDKAGNKTSTKWQSRVDVGDPVVAVSGWPGQTWKRNSASLVFTAQDAIPAGLSFRATIDGQPATLSAAKAAVADSTASQGAGGYSLATGKLCDGQHEVGVTVTNIAGHSTTWTQSFLVNSTDSLGGAQLGPGATGQDVKRLQQILTQRGLYKGPITSILDAATQQAVVSYKTAHGLPSTPLVDATTLKDLLGFIRVDRGKCKLYLYQDGQLVKTYTVAVGQPAWPSPVGTFVIISKVVNPTWIPPNSSWAAGAKPIGPGPSDPLQARVMWLSAPAVGIHGTNEPWTVGTHASHGCIRMRVPDVEDLFTRVFVGTQVQIMD